MSDVDIPENLSVVVYQVKRNTIDIVQLKSILNQHNAIIIKKDTEDGMRWGITGRVVWTALSSLISAIIGAVVVYFLK